MREVIDQCKAYLLRSGAISAAYICMKYKRTYESALKIEEIVRKEVEAETLKTEPIP